jgi:radical SAM family uncharacterized protein
LAVERVFSPWIDLEALLRKKGIPLWSLESKTPLHRFDILGITLPYEMTFTNVLNLLDLGKIPIDRHARQDSHPIVIGGGPSAANPLPLASFFDAFLIGDGEGALNEAGALVAEAKRRQAPRGEILDALASLEGFWVPSRPGSVRRRVCKEFSRLAPPLRPIVPHIQAVHDRVPLEIFRGCMQGCRFCNAGFFYRPKRERQPDQLAAWAQDMMRATGEESLGLLSLSTSDYSCLPDLIARIDDSKVFPEQTFSIPSMRMNQATLALLDANPRLKKGGLTFAPEAGTQRLRNIIGKRITDRDILSVVEATHGSIYRTVKLYFMIGLPFETDRDIDGIIDLVRRIDQVARRMKPRKTISLSLSGFVPKPFTPFQWCEQTDLETLKKRRQRIVNGVAGTGAKVSWREEFLCQLEAVLARGDEQVGRLLSAAHQRGCRFDGWNEVFSAAGWQAAFTDSGIDPAAYTRAFPVDDPLPWDFIDFRTPKAYLQRELQAATTEATEDHP